jgi:hypothetical protein
MSTRTFTLDQVAAGALGRDAVQEVERFAEVFVRRLLLVLFMSLVRMTPVDTGRARNAWATGLNAPPDYVPAEGLGQYPAPQPPISEAERFRLNMILWLVNNVQYIGILDEGWSRQAPAGMTSVAFADLEAQFG